MRRIRLLIWENWCVPLCLSVILSFPVFSHADGITSCNINILGGMSFTYSTSGATTNGTIGSITCNYTGVPQQVYIYLTNQAGGSVNPRQMTSGPNTLNYNLYTNAGYSLIWGDGLNGTNAAGPFDCSGSPSPCTVSLPPPSNLIYGSIPAAAPVLAGDYQQTIIASVATSANGGPTFGSNGFVVATHVPTSCSISATNVSLDYPSNSPTAVTGNSVLQIQCNTPGSYPVTLQSVNSGAINGSGILKDAANHALVYQMYQPASNTPNAACAYSIAWGAVPGFNAMVPNTSANNYNACLSMPPLQSAAAGSYSDTVNATISF